MTNENVCPNSASVLGLDGPKISTKRSAWVSLVALVEFSQRMELNKKCEINCTSLWGVLNLLVDE